MLKERTFSYKTQADGTFSIENYAAAKPFANFLPGVAGPFGIPLWVFFVNRGQGIAGFGLRDKDHAIMEFVPANRAYAEAPFRGFRTFIKLPDKKQPDFYEPFQNHLHGQRFETTQWMHVRPWGFSLEERNMSLGLEVTVEYFTLPNEPLGALARKTTIKNLSMSDRPLEICDGLAAIVPSGLNDFFLKNMSRTVEAWMTCEISSGPEAAVFFKLRSDPFDRPEYKEVEDAHFYASFLSNDTGKTAFPSLCVDPGVMFGPNLDFSDPRAFLTQTPFSIPSDQMREGKTPCAFSCFATSLKPQQSVTLYSYTGWTNNAAKMQKRFAAIASPEYFRHKAEENRTLIRRLMAPAATLSGSREYDLYCAQSFLDNVLRGGYPWVIPAHKTNAVFHVYSRKHGDLERDYNRFILSPTYLSQGEGNYRDINQNRRCEVWFEPRVGDASLKQFFNLLQIDGYNPLVLKELRLRFASPKKLAAALKPFVSAPALDELAVFAAEPRTPGEILTFLDECAPLSTPAKEQALAALFRHADPVQSTEHSQGFWSDHWTYNLDLLENYLAIYPEELENLMFKKKEFTFYDNAFYVKPRAEKYRVMDDGAVRQLGSVEYDEVKSAMMRARSEEPEKMRARNGKGRVYTTTLAAKILSLVSNKFGSLDPEATGLEMEADRPDWLDSLNGLPALFGSSISGAFELRRLIGFLDDALAQASRKVTAVALPVELALFLAKLRKAAERNARRGARAKTIDFWNETHDAKEDFWLATRRGVKGTEKRVPVKALRLALKAFAARLDKSFAAAYDAEKEICPTYFINELVSYRVKKRKARSNGKLVATRTVVPLKFKQRRLPPFLEGPVHAMRIEKDPIRVARLYDAVRSSELFDRKLGMYRVCAPLDAETPEIGRIRVFAPGWLENQAIFMHMEYKFLLECLRKGLYAPFFSDLPAALVPFQDPKGYGRSIFENSSFIVSSVYGDKKLHGTGFAARLSGSTSELLEMWLIMNIGRKPFFLDETGKLSLRFAPALAPWFFTQADAQREILLATGAKTQLFLPKHSFAFVFLGRTLVVYHNPRLAPTYGPKRAAVKRIVFQNSKGETVMINGDALPSPHSQAVREGRIARIDVELG